MKKLLLFVLFALCPMLLMKTAAAQDFTYNTNFVSARADAGVKLPANATFSQWVLSWNNQSALTSCTVQVDTSSDGVSWVSGGLFTATPCTTASSVRLKGTSLTGVFFVRINVTVLSGSNPIGLNVSLQGWSGAF